MLSKSFVLFRNIGMHLVSNYEFSRHLHKMTGRTVINASTYGIVSIFETISASLQTYLGRVSSIFSKAINLCHSPAVKFRVLPDSC